MYDACWPRMLIVCFIFALSIGKLTAGEPAEDILHAIAHLREYERLTPQQPFRMDLDAAAACGPNAAPSQEDPHSDYYCHVYVSPAAKELYHENRSPYPVGTLFIKRKFADAKGKAPELYTVMRKMNSGYDDENGNWEYSVIDKTGQKILSRGRTDSCISCHRDYATNDYITRAYTK